MTNNTTEEEFYPGFPTRWLLALSLPLTALIYLFIFIRGRQLYGLVNILAIQLTIHGLTALACGWLTNRLKLWRNVKDVLFFITVGCLLHKLIDTAIDGLMNPGFLQTLKFALQSALYEMFSLSYWLPNWATLGTMLAGIFLLPAGSADDWREDDYPRQPIYWLLLPMAALPVLVFLFHVRGVNGLVLIIALLTAGIGVVATFYLRWLAKRFRFYRRPGDFVSFTLLGLLVSGLIELLLLVVGTLAIVLLFRIPLSYFINAIYVALLYGNLPGLALGLLVGCFLLPAGSADDWREEDDWQGDDYPKQPGYWLLLPMAVLPALAFVLLGSSLDTIQEYERPFINTIMLSITPLVLGAGVVATFYLRWMAKQFRFFRRPGHIAQFLLLGLLTGFIIELLVFMSGTPVINPLTELPLEVSVFIGVLAPVFFNLPGLALGLLLGCFLLPRAPDR